MTPYQERVRREVLEENTELVYEFLRTHPDAAMHWVDIRCYPSVNDGDLKFGFWEIYSPTNYTTHEYGFPWRGDDMNMLAYEVMDWENKDA